MTGAPSLNQQLRALGQRVLSGAPHRRLRKVVLLLESEGDASIIYSAIGADPDGAPLQSADMTTVAREYLIAKGRL